MAQPAPAAQAAQPAQPAPLFDDTLAPGAAVGSRTPISESDNLTNLIYNRYNTLHRSVDGRAFMPLLADAGAYHAAHTTPGPGSAFMREPMHFDKRNYIQCNIDLRNFADAAITTQYPQSHPAKKLLQKVLSYWTSANSLKQLERFADTRQPTLHRVPTPDGTNLHRNARSVPPAQYVDELYFEHYLRRLWIRHLHLPGLMAANTGREYSLRSLYNCGRAVGFFRISYLISHHELSLALEQRLSYRHKSFLRASYFFK
jgi:hypothetical protein